MENMNENATGSRKKFLAPLVVLLLCVVSLTGAAYAYSSTVTVVNNTVTGEEYVLEVYSTTEATSTISEAFSVDALRIYSETTVGVPDKVVVKAETYSVDDSNVIKGKLTLKDTTVGTGDQTAVRNITLTTDFVKKSETEKYDGVIDYTEVAEGQSGSVGYKFTIGLYTNSACTEQYNPTVAIDFDNCIATLYYVVTIEATPASATGITFDNTTPQDDVDAVQTQLGLEKFVLIFTANPAA